MDAVLSSVVVVVVFELLDELDEEDDELDEEDVEHGVDDDIESIVHVSLPEHDVEEPHDPPEHCLYVVFVTQ